MPLRALALLFITLLLFKCSRDNSESNKQIALDRASTLNTHDIVNLKSLYSSDATGESPNWGGIGHGADSIAMQYSRYFVSSPDWKIETRQILTAPDHVVYLFTMSGTMTHVEKGTPDYMLGKKYSLEGCTLLELKYGKITHEASYFDQVAFLRQVGFFEQK